MAKIGRLLPAVVVTAGNPNAVNDTPVTTTTVGGAYDLSGQLGAVLRSADGNYEWIYATIATTGTGKAPAVGSLCYWWSSTSTSTTNQYQWTVDTNTTASNSLVTMPAGVLNVAATRGNRVFLLRKAPRAIVASTTTYSTAGSVVVVSSTQTGDPCVTISTSTDPSVGNYGRASIGILNSVSTARTVTSATSTSGFTVFMDVALDIE